MDYQYLEKKVVDYFKKNPSRFHKPRELAKFVQVPNHEYQPFKRFIKNLVREGKLKRYKGNRYGPIINHHYTTGILHVKTQGYGFLIRDDGRDDIFISQRNMGHAFHRDRVRAELFARNPGRLWEGRIIEVLERGKERIVGQIVKSGSFVMVVPDDIKINRDIYINRKNQKDAKIGQKVVVEVINWHDARSNPEGRVVDVLGFPHEKGVDILSVAYGFDLPMKFSDDVEKAAETISSEIINDMVKNRLDLRDQLTFTIDPEDAMDHDDAISLECLEQGNILLGVHIADVSYFIKSGSVIDIEAMKRGTSVYLIDRVIPMLPRRLSNDICSLKSQKDRLAFSVLMELTPEGVLKNYRIQETVIQSDFKLSYKQVQTMLDKMRPDHKFDSEGESVSIKNKMLYHTLQLMSQLAQKLKTRCIKMGSIDFNVPEPLIEMDEKGYPIRLGLKPRYKSHEMVEAFMLLANRTVAQHIEKQRNRFDEEYPFIYRVHGQPSGKKLESFIQFVRALGYDFEVGKKITPKKFLHFLDKLHNTPHELIIKEVALRTMMKAEYNTQNIGHFGLAFKYYTHFTSPIRRYPDLMVHRLLKEYEKIENGTMKTPVKLSKICEIATEREIIAQEAERESILIKQVEYMEKHMGDEFDGVISGVISFGFFVEIPQYLVEGLVHVEYLKDDYYLFDEKHYRLIGEYHGRIYQLGDSVKVQIIRATKDLKKINFALVQK